MSKKDPAFLFYSKDWIDGTAEMTSAEKGVYIDLLAYQHQRGDLPNEIKRLCILTRLPENEFLAIWETIKLKFVIEGDRMYNRKLTDCMTERSTKGLRNKIIGTFAGLLRKSNLDKNQYKAIKEMFKVEDFTNTDTERITERLTEWLALCLKSIEDANANTIYTISIEDRLKNFKESLYPFSKKNGGIYDSETLNAFFTYWTELNRPKTKMLFEMRETWELSKRLATWEKNNFHKKETALEKAKKPSNL